MFLSQAFRKPFHCHNSVFRASTFFLLTSPASAWQMPSNMTKQSYLTPSGCDGVCMCRVKATCGHKDTFEDCVCSFKVPQRHRWCIFFFFLRWMGPFSGILCEQKGLCSWKKDVSPVDAETVVTLCWVLWPLWSFRRQKDSHCCHNIWLIDWKKKKKLPAISMQCCHIPWNYTSSVGTCVRFCK